MNDIQIYRLIRLAAVMLGHLPRPVLKFCADILGLVWYHADRRHRNVVLENIRCAYPEHFSDEQAKRFVRANFRHTIGILFDVIWFYPKKKEKVFEYFSIKGMHHLENALEKNKGVIGLTCHMGNFELLAAAIAKTGINPYVLYRKLDFNPLEIFVREMRQRFGTTMIPLRQASKKVEDLLRQGKLIGTLLDQNVDWYKGVFVDFFGRPACTNNGFAKLVLKTQASVVPVFIVQKEGRFIMEFFPEIPLEKTGDKIKDIENNTQNYVSAIEFMVRKCPEQYFWVHNRWKTRPFCMINPQLPGKGEA